MDLTKKIKLGDVFYDHEGESFIAKKVTTTWVESECGRDFDESDIDFDMDSPVSEVCVSKSDDIPTAFPSFKNYRKDLDLFALHFNERFKVGDVLNNSNLLAHETLNFTLKKTPTSSSFYVSVATKCICIRAFDTSTPSSWTVFTPKRGWIQKVNQQQVPISRSPCPLGEEFRAKEKGSISAQNKSYSLEIVKPFEVSKEPMNIKISTEPSRRYNLDITVEQLPEPMKIVLSNKPIKLNF
jgi:hypothetical protein